MIRKPEKLREKKGADDDTGTTKQTASFLDIENLERKKKALPYVRTYVRKRDDDQEKSPVDEPPALYTERGKKANKK